MSIDAHVTVQRGGTPVYTGVPVQLDKLSQQEAADYGGAAPYERFDVFSLAGNVTILQKDLLIDQTTGVHYRILLDGEPFPDYHWEAIADKMRVT